MKPQLVQVFEGVIDKLSDVVKEGLLESCRIDSESRKLYACCSFKAYVKTEEIRELQNELCSGLVLQSANIVSLFEPESFCVEAAQDIATSIKAENAIINGYFNDAVFSETEDSVEIELKHGGYKTIENSGFEREFKNRIKDMFGLEKEIIFKGQIDDVEMSKPEYKQVAFVSSSNFGGTEKKSHDFTKVTGIEIPDGCALIPDSIEKVHGRKFSGKIINLDSISPDEDAVAWGEIFFAEIVPTKSGKGYRIKLQIYDGTGSITVKTVVSTAQGEILADVLKKGKCVVVSGVYKMDEWEKDYIFEPSSIALAKKQGGRNDTCEEKRVELHLHTSMSQMDAVSPVKDIIKQAFKWGHKAVAITDHGVVQAFPDAMSAVDDVRREQGGEDFKVIYGVEDYFVNDIDGQKTEGGIDGGVDSTTLTRYHQIILVKNQIGLKNLYRLVSFAHLNYYLKTFNKDNPSKPRPARPLVPKSVLMKYREGLII
ncbi:MAG: PHP domain-containing protein, partial [Clostridia bacterium]|nr:PHP domain-containing protein [Clostridia bacterium]